MDQDFADSLRYPGSRPPVKVKLEESQRMWFLRKSGKNGIGGGKKERERTERTVSRSRALPEENRGRRTK